MRRSIPALLTLVLAGCHVQTVEDPSPTRPSQPIPAERPGAEAASVRVLGPIAMDAQVEGTLSGEATPPGYVVTLARGARVSISLTVDARAGVVVYGPLAGTWDEAPSVARGGERTELTAPAEGTYLVSVRGPAASTASFALVLTCTGGECRAQCGPDLTCPAGASCAVVQCIRAPCPSYCEAQASVPPPSTSPGVPGGAMCGTRGTGPCPAGQFCDWPQAAQCGEFDAPGTCQPIPQMCTREYNPVCGCDRQTYPSPCTAWSSGVSVRSAGPCDASAGNEPTTPAAGACERGGCGGELCHEPGEGRASICVARPEHACYRSATCERQPGGACGWTQTPALRACIANPPPVQ